MKFNENEPCNGTKRVVQKCTAGSAMEVMERKTFLHKLHIEKHVPAYLPICCYFIF